MDVYLYIPWYSSICMYKWHAACAGSRIPARHITVHMVWMPGNRELYAVSTRM
jgi:hypothetical protein